MGEDRYSELRRRVLNASLLMLKQALVTGTSGNVSGREPGADWVAITPSGVPYESMKPDDICIVDLSGRLVCGRHRPSSETPMHTLIYRERRDVLGVVHTHSPYALAFAIVKKPIRPVCVEAIGSGRGIPVADYALLGTEDIGRSALAALGTQHKAVLLQNHGVLAIGPSVEAAMTTACKVEDAARAYYLALGIGEPVVLSDEQLSAIDELRRK
ncbi:MAG: class II aldolase/adducin family protein [Bacillota bacterium]